MGAGVPARGLLSPLRGATPRSEAPPRPSFRPTDPFEGASVDLNRPGSPLFHPAGPLFRPERPFLHPRRGALGAARKLLRPPENLRRRNVLPEGAQRRGLENPLNRRRPGRGHLPDLARAPVAAASPELNDLAASIPGRAQRLYPVDLVAFVLASSPLPHHPLGGGRETALALRRLFYLQPGPRGRPAHRLDGKMLMPAGGRMAPRNRSRRA
jgi:hypothetical protein